jgi:capsule biosynthesis phosphatase
MRIVIDLDGVLCPVKQKKESYADLKPLPGGVAFLQKLHDEGHYIIIQTARNMATCEGNIGKVLKNVGLVTLEWLEKYGIVYDEIYFGKPNGEIYIDDRAFRFVGWQEMTIEQIVQEAKER